MRNDTENKKSRAGPFYADGLARLSIFCGKCGGCQVASTDFWTLKNGKIYMGNPLNAKVTLCSTCKKTQKKSCLLLQRHLVEFI